MLIRYYAWETLHYVLGGARLPVAVENVGAWAL